MPLGSMDGGRIGNSISPWFGAIGVGLGGGLIYSGVIYNPIFYLIMLGGTYSTVTRLLGYDDDDRSKDYYRIGKEKQLTLLLSYIALVSSLLLAMRENNKHRKTPKQLKNEIYYDEWTENNKENNNNVQAVYDDYFSNDNENDNNFLNNNNNNNNKRW
jgi:hypothetical protein